VSLLFDKYAAFTVGTAVAIDQSLASSPIVSTRDSNRALAIIDCALHNARRRHRKRKGRGAYWEIGPRERPAQKGGRVETIRKLVERPSNALIAVACCIAVLMMLHVVLDVFSKYLLNSPINGTIEIVAGYYMVAIVFFPLAYVARREGHILVELFTRRMRPGRIRRLDAVIGIFTFGYMALFTWMTMVEALHRTAQLEIWEIGTFNIPIWPSRWLITIGCGMMAAYVLYRLADDFRGHDE
jgi:TRAP-type C4-dicarboxylate transport system permease small subunit